MNYINYEQGYRSRLSSSCSLKSDDDSDDFDIDDDASQTNSSSNYSLINSVSSHSHSLNEKRKSRNQNEKKRRDQFNMLIQELGGLLNHPRKIDKATVLNETLYYFRNYNDKPLYNKEIGFKWKPFFLENDEFMRFMIDFQNAFCLVFDLNGTIKYVSDDLMHLLGHNPKKIQNSNLIDLIDETSAKNLKSLLKMKTYNNLEPIYFQCRFKKGFCQNISHELFRIKGFFKKTPNENGGSVGVFNTVAKLDSFMQINEIYPRESNKKEFTSEYSLEFKYTALDSKATEIVGYNQIEVLGTSFYDYCHHEDLEKILECHKKLIHNGAIQSLSFRFRTKGQQWIWLQTNFQVVIDQFNSKPQTIVGNNQLIGYNIIYSRDAHMSEPSSSSSYASKKINTLLDETSRQNMMSKSSHMNALNVSQDFLSHEAKHSATNPYTDDENNTNPKKSCIKHEAKSYEEQQQSFLNKTNECSVVDDENNRDIQEIIDLNDQQSNVNNQSVLQSKVLGSSPSNQQSIIIPSQQQQQQQKLSPSNKDTKSERELDDSLGTIFMKSYYDLKYRSYVLSQFRMKKNKIEALIRKNQEELKILEETMENISDDKKLASWVSEFQRQELNSLASTTSYSSPASISSNSLFATKPINTSNNFNLKNENNSSNNVFSKLTPAPSSSTLLTNEVQMSSSPDENNNNNSNSINSNASSSSSSNGGNNNNSNNSKNRMQRFIENIQQIQHQSFNQSASKGLIKQEQHLQSNVSLKKENNSTDLSSTPSNVRLLEKGAISSMSNLESDLVGDLLSFQNLLSNGPNSQSNFDMDTEINTEMIDKFFNNYTYE